MSPWQHLTYLIITFHQTYSSKIFQMALLALFNRTISYKLLLTFKSTILGPLFNIFMCCVICIHSLFVMSDLLKHRLIMLFLSINILMNK